MKPLASDAGVHVFEFRCTSQPDEAPFEERHQWHSLAFVQSGSFGCRSNGRSYEFIPGSVFVGYPDDTYVCHHDHHHGGDRCLVFDFDASIVDEVGGGELWRCTAIGPRSPLSTLLGLAAGITGRNQKDMGLPELGLLAAFRFARLKDDNGSAALKVRDRRRAVEAAMSISELCAEDIQLAGLASAAGLSPFHFLRTFAAVFGITPHQYLISCRLRRAAELLGRGELPITEVALEAGFADLSNFIRTFKRASGYTPSRFRRLSLDERTDLTSRFRLAEPN